MEFTFKDILRFVTAEIFTSAGYDHEILLQRIQFGIVLVGSNPFFG